MKTYRLQNLQKTVSEIVDGNFMLYSSPRNKVSETRATHNIDFTYKLKFQFCFYSTSIKHIVLPLTRKTLRLYIKFGAKLNSCQHKNKIKITFSLLFCRNPFLYVQHISFYLGSAKCFCLQRLNQGFGQDSKCRQKKNKSFHTKYQKTLARY